MDTWTLPQTQIVIVNYEKFSQVKTEQLLKDIEHRKFDCLILDEAHRIKSRGSKVFKNIWQLRKIPHRLLLTGTPGHDTPEDMWTLLRMLEPQKRGSYWKWVDEWMMQKPIYTAHGEVMKPCGIKPSLKRKFAEELSGIAIQRKRNEVMDWAGQPDIVDIKLPCNKQQTQYLDALKKYYSVGDIMCQGILDRLVRYRQICAAPAILELKGKSPKLDWTCDFIKDNPDKSILVFSNSRKVLDLLNSMLKKCLYINGGVLPSNRQEIVRTFQKGYAKVLLIQTQSGKEGLTLDKADVEIFLDVYPPASDYEQAKDRMVPTNQYAVKTQTIYRLMMKNTFDEECYRMVDNHTKQCDCINNFRRYLDESTEKEP